MADPPWHFRARTALQMRTGRAAATRKSIIRSSALDDIKALPVATSRTRTRTCSSG
jgi:hypothetical protein